MDNSAPEAFIFMKVGPYGDECLDEILDRKNCELKGSEKMIFWGYGERGPLHPTKQVKRFVELWDEEDTPIEVLMEETTSNPKRGSGYLGTEFCKEQYSKDGENWKKVPSDICTDSDHALVLDEIRECPLELDLREFEVGIGDKKGTNATQYLAFRGMKKLTGRRRGADKGCLVVAKSPHKGHKVLKNPAFVKIKYRAQLKFPYAVFLK